MEKNEIDLQVKKVSESFKLSLRKLSINDFFNLKDLDDAIYQIEIDGPPICILLKNTKIKSEIGLLSLHGAINQETRQKGFVPHFTGLNISSNFKTPFIAISDPNLFLSEELYLSWFSGNQHTNIQEKIAFIIDLIAIKLGCEFLAFGGSGGGFASLIYTSLCKEIKKAFVWNPQTSISEYYPKFWKEFSLYSFGEKVKTKDQFIKKMDEVGLIHNLVETNLNYRNKKVLYIQNESDDHKVKHALPFAKNKLNFNGKFYENENILMIFGNWGIGHAIPPKSLIVKSIKLLIEDNMNEIEELIRINSIASQKKAIASATQKSGINFIHSLFKKYFKICQKIKNK